jgi:ABC-type bacteriocin/lantibiotic exporter with double-glycine peptidase domain
MSNDHKHDNKQYSLSEFISSAPRKLLPYVQSNQWTCVGLIMLPVIDCGLSMWLRKSQDAQEDYTNAIRIALSSVGMPVIYVLERTFSFKLSISVQQAIKEDNVNKITDGSTLIYLDKTGFSTLQYVTVGSGVDQFVENTIPMFATLPMDIISYAIGLYVIGSIANMNAVVVALSFTCFVSGVTFLAGWQYQKFSAANQENENSFTSVMNSIDENGALMVLTNTINDTRAELYDLLQQVSNRIPTITTIFSMWTAMHMIAVPFASQLFGSYYTDNDINNLDVDNIKILNLMLMSINVKAQDIVALLAVNYGLAKVPFAEIQNFDKAYKDCTTHLANNNTAKYSFDSPVISLRDFTVDVKIQDDVTVHVCNNVSVDFAPRKIYKLTGKIGSGKSTFIKALTGHGEYTKGIVSLPKYCLISQHKQAFPKNISLLDILQLGLSDEQHDNIVGFCEPTNDDIEANLLHNDNTTDYEATLASTQKNSRFVELAIELLKITGLGHIVQDLYDRTIDWNSETKLSGGQKQIIPIIRAILSNKPLIIMDEATNALDHATKNKIYKLLKEHITKMDNGVILYVDHEKTTHDHSIDTLVNNCTNPLLKAAISEEYQRQQKEEDNFPSFYDAEVYLSNSSIHIHDIVSDNY